MDLDKIISEEPSLVSQIMLTSYRQKEIIKPQLSPQEQLTLQLFNGRIDAITAHKELLELETKELNKTIEAQEEIIKKLNTCFK